ncbi:potassium-transporting ATPase subunit KdpC [Nakamurella endophytica]
MSAGATLAVTGRQLWIAARFLVAMTVVLGVLYPLAVLGIGQLVAHRQADGSLLTDASGRTVGSALLGQRFEGPQWFVGRPSAAGDGYDAMASGGSNLAADSPELVTTVEQRRAEIARRDGVPGSAVPDDAVTASGSGLDPDISPEYARIQVLRVAQARGLPVDRVRQLVQAHVEHPALGFLGQDRVNVLELNLALAGLGR